MKRFFICLGSSFCLGLLGAHATTILDDTFADGDRTNQALPSSAAWYSASANTTNLQTSAGSLEFTSLTHESGILASLPSFTLTSGQSVTVSFTFSVTGASNTTANTLRLGLFNSNGAPVTADGWDTATGPSFAGYGAWGNMGDSGGSTSSGVLYRSAITDPLFGGSALHTEAGGTAPTGGDFNLTSGQSYTGTFTILDNGASNTISFALNGVSLSAVTDSAHDYTTFDTLAFLLPANSASSVDFTEISVSTSAVPEPGCLTLAILGAAALALVGLRKRTHA